jgi:hypothetical protein
VPTGAWEIIKASERWGSASGNGEIGKSAAQRVMTSVGSKAGDR